MDRRAQRAFSRPPEKAGTPSFAQRATFATPLVVALLLSSSTGRAAEPRAEGAPASPRPAKSSATRPLTEGPRRPEQQPVRAVRPRGKRPSLTTSPAFTGPAELPTPTVDDLALRREGDGTYLYVDPGHNFTARFNNDGTVSFADRWKRPDKRNPAHGVCCGWPPGMGVGTAMEVTGPTEWVMWMAGQDPGARLKAELLKKTAPMRYRLAVEYNLQLLAQRFAELDGDLYALWSRRDVPLVRRRALLFQLWDECDEAFALAPGDVPGEALSFLDEARKHTAERARRTIESFVRRQLPRGTRHAFTDAELRAFNDARESQQSFDPYTPRPEPPPLDRPRGTPWDETPGGTPGGAADPTADQAAGSTP